MTNNPAREAWELGICWFEDKEFPSCIKKTPWPIDTPTLVDWDDIMYFKMLNIKLFYYVTLCYVTWFIMCEENKPKVVDKNTITSLFEEFLISIVLGSLKYCTGDPYD